MRILDKYIIKELLGKLIDIAWALEQGGLKRPKSWQTSIEYLVNKTEAKMPNGLEQEFPDDIH